MSAITLDGLCDLMRKHETPFLKIEDFSKNRILDLVNDEDIETTINELKRFLPTLQSYGRLIVRAANNSEKKRNFSDAYRWTVDFSQGQVLRQDTAIGTPQRGFISASEATLMAQYEALKLQVSYDRKFDELQRQIDNKNKDDIFSNVDRFLPYAPIFIKDEKTLEKIMSIASMQGAMNGKQIQSTGMAGKQETVMSTEKTEQEVQKDLDTIQANISALIKAVGIEKVLKLTTGIKEKPHMVDAALGFL